MGNSLFYNPSRLITKQKFVMIEKIGNSNFLKEESLWQGLKECGFSEHIIEIPLNNFNKIKKKLNLPFKTKIEIINTWLVGTIGKNRYDVYSDMWDVELRKNGVVIFCSRRFDNMDLFNLID
jgi:hypothetical protein